MEYILYIILVAFFCYIGDKRRNGTIKTRVIPLLLFICFVGFRSYTVGVDSESYMDLFYAIPSQNYLWIERGFDWLIRFLYDHGLAYNTLYIACAILTSVPVFIVLEKSENYTMSASFFYIFSLISVTNGLRQCIAVGAFVLGYLFIKERKILGFASCMAFAFLFHYSCVVLFPLYFILDKSLKPKVYTLIYVLSFIFVFVNPTSFFATVASWITFIGKNYQDGFGSSYDLGILSLFGFLYTTFLNVCIFIFIQETNQFEKNPVLANCTFAGLVLKNFSMNLPIVGRLSLYFQWFPYLLLPIMIAELAKDNKKLELQYKLMFIALYSIGFIHNIYGTTMKMTPYVMNFNLFQ